MSDKRPYVAVLIEECCNHFAEVLAVGTEREMQDFADGYSDPRLNAGYGVVVEQAEHETPRGS